MKYIINETEYKFVKGDKDTITDEIINEKITEYFYDYDYIFGDVSYNKIRLKGFNETGGKATKEINDVKYLDKYIKDYCAYGCKWFLLKKCK